jgi:tetratricopeptide (TPR) repeat protein
VRGELQHSDPDRIGPYRLVEVLGGGGMGRVYLGRSAGGRPVAVKVIRPELAVDGEFRDRFRREVAAARRVNGFYTAIVVDADTEGPVPWLATAHVDAPTLADAVRTDGPLPAPRLRDLAAGLAEGLAAIHAAGLVHRDLKPSNVLLAADGPRIIDFGIAWIAEAPSLTGTGLLIGSPGFMSPEQARSGRGVGPASDVFSLGSLLCYAATGRSPWGAAYVTTLLYRVVHEEPDVANVPEPIRDLVARCLAKDPARRPTAAQILAEFGDQHTPARTAAPTPTKGSRTVTAVPAPAAAPAPAAVAPGPGNDRTITVNAPARAGLFSGEQPLAPVVAGQVPQAPSAFQPRHDLMSQLRAAGAGVSIIRAITGMRGVGKTQLAAAFARQCRDEGWRLVAWVNAEDTPAVLSGLAVVADRLGIDRSGKTLEVIGGEVRNRLEADGDRCLIVFDNVADFDVVRPYVPALGAPQVVLTTTEASVAGSGRPVQVGVFSDDEALAFLAERTGRTGPGDRDGARELAAELGCLPLALAEAAAVISAQRLTYPRYLARLRAHSAGAYLRAAKGDPYPRGVAEAILLSVEAVTASDPAGLCADLLGIVSLLSAEGVSREILYRGESAGVWPDGPDSEEAVDEASLLTFSGDDSVIAHRLVMRVIREQAMHDGTLPALAAKAVTLLNAYREPLEEALGRRAESRECLRQLTALADHLAGQPAADSADLLSLRIWGMESSLALGDNPDEMIELGEKLVRDCERVLGPAHRYTLGSRSNLGYAYRVAGRLDRAVPLLEAALADLERELGPAHEETVSSRNNLALTYRAVGRPDQAVPLLEEVVAESERGLGMSHPGTLKARCNLALVYHDTGRVDEALPLLESVVADSDRVLGPANRETLNARNSLALAYRDVGRMDEVVPLLESILAGRVAALGTSHPDTLLSRNNLARGYEHTGRVGEAVPLLEGVVADAGRVLGPSHPATLAFQGNLATVYRKAGRLSEAIPLSEESLAESERVLGASHPSTLRSRGNLAQAYRDAGRLGESMSLFEQVVAGMEEVFGAEHPSTVEAGRDLAAIRQLVTAAGDPAGG